MNPKRKKFAEEYVIDLNGSAAAIRAGYSHRTSRFIASKLLDDPEIAEYIGRLKKKIARHNEVDASRVLQEQARIAFAMPKVYFDEDGSLKNIHQLSDDAAASISGIEVETVRSKRGNGDEYETSQIKKLRFWNKKDALDSLAKFLEMYKGKGENPLEVNIMDQITKRAEELADKVKCDET